MSASCTCCGNATAARAAVKRLSRLSLACAGCVVVAACALAPAPMAASAGVPVRTLATADAAALVRVGSSTQADAMAALGPTNSIRFASGYEVWVYHYPGIGRAAQRGEFVLLFAPSGVLVKARMRSASGTGEAVVGGVSGGIDRHGCAAASYGCSPVADR